MSIKESVPISLPNMLFFLISVKLDSFFRPLTDMDYLFNSEDVDVFVLAFIICLK